MLSYFCFFWCLPDHAVERKFLALSKINILAPAAGNALNNYTWTPLYILDIPCSRYISLARVYTVLSHSGFAVYKRVLRKSAGYARTQVDWPARPPASNKRSDRFV